MGQKEISSKTARNADVFVELHIEDLVKDRLFWQAQVESQAFSGDVMPSVIHTIESSLTALRSIK
jgi:hypothetical protein